MVLQQVIDLVKIYNEKQVVKNIDPNIQIYTGGPGSNIRYRIMTNIRFGPDFKEQVLIMLQQLDIPKK